MTTYGFPADCESGKAMQELAAIFDARIKPDEIRQDILKYQEIIADQTGKKRDAYYEEQKQEIEELYGDAEDDPDAPDGYDYQSLFDNILSPEEQLQSIYRGGGEEHKSDMTEVYELIRVNSIGYVKQMQLLTSFEDAAGMQVYVYYKKVVH